MQKATQPPRPTATTRRRRPAARRPSSPPSPPRADGRVEARRVVCGTDFTAAARRAADVAFALATHLGAPLTLVHARPTARGPEATRLMEREVRRLQRQAATATEVVFAAGTPAKVLTHLAQADTGAQIVVASHGKRGARRWLLGSVSERTAASASVPTWIVRRPRPVLDWLAGRRPLRVFLGFDRTPASEAALAWVAGLPALGACEVVIAHLDWPPEEAAAHSLSGPVPLVGNPPRLQALLDHEIADRIRTHLDPATCRLRVEANWGRADVRLAQMAREERADLVVTGCRHAGALLRLWQSSVSRGVLRNTRTNVVIVPSTGDQPRS